MKKTLSIIGFGTFGQFITPHLSPHFDISVWNRSDYQSKASELGVQWVRLKEALSKEIIILCTNISFFESFLKENAHLFNPNALVLDVASVKILPIELMVKYLPSTCEIIGTHPLFGPQSGKNGIQNLNFVISPVRSKKVDCLKDFAENTLKLKVFVKSAEEHDREMAYVQALTHFVARAINEMNIPDSPLSTQAYLKLLELKGLLSGDSFELFKAIENNNPFAKEIRENFKSQLIKLENLL